MVESLLCWVIRKAFGIPEKRSVTHPTRAAIALDFTSVADLQAWLETTSS